MNLGMANHAPNTDNAPVREIMCGSYVPGKSGIKKDSIKFDNPEYDGFCIRSNEPVYKDNCQKFGEGGCNKK